MGSAPTASVTSRRPYLLRAMHEWISDNRQTPHLVVDAEAEGVDVPRQYVKDGKIILNVSHHATTGLKLGNESIEFTARFSGAARAVHVPIRAVLGIYARESGQGMIFNDNDLSPDPSGGKPTPGPDDGRRPHLKVVK
ncbi:MAG TPA: ClpXP protease specificity-enhancing factor [Steroidobacteraceae bacterium]|jgi:stringent starvation protein B